MKRFKNILVCLLLSVMVLQARGQCNTSFPFGNAELNVTSGTGLTSISYFPIASSYNQKTRIKHLMVQARLDLEKDGVYPMGKLDWAADLSLRCTFKNGAGDVIRVREMELHGLPTRPAVLAEVNVTDLEARLGSVEVDVVNYAVTGTQEQIARDRIRCVVELVQEVAFDVNDLQGRAFSVLGPKTAPIACDPPSTEVCQVRFSWVLPNNRKVPRFEVALVKLEPKINGLPLEIDWKKATRLILETNSPLLESQPCNWPQENVLGNVQAPRNLQTIGLQAPQNYNATKYEFAYLIAEGSGYYAWRVRPIGDFYDRGMSDASNYGAWNTTASSFANHQYTWKANNLDLQSVNPDTFSLTASVIAVRGSIFYYTQFDQDKNFIYGRIFSEMSRMAETMTYANGLSQVQQTQTKSYSQNEVMATQSVQDYSGRPALQSMVAPTGSDQIHYRSDFFRKSGNQPYQAGDFDADGSIYPGSSNVDGSMGPGFYYSDQNSDARFLHGNYVPDANGFPYIRTLYYPDATGRVYKQSAPGDVMRLKDASGHNVTSLYGDVTQEELDVVFGNEGAVDTTTYKVVTHDPNGVSSVSYMGKNGAVLATCLSYTGPLTNLDTVGNESKPGIQHLNYRLDGGSFAPGEQRAKRQTSIVVESEQTTAPLYYEITPQSFGITCATDVCYSCDYRVEFQIVLSQDPSKHARFYFDIAPKRLAQCLATQSALVLGSPSLPYDSVKFDPGNTLPPDTTTGMQGGILSFRLAGTYLITKTLFANNPTGVSNGHWLDAYLDSLRVMRAGWTADSNCCGPIHVDTVGWDCNASEPLCGQSTTEMADSLMYWIRMEQAVDYHDALSQSGDRLRGNAIHDSSVLKQVIDGMIGTQHLNCSDVWTCFQAMGGLLEQNVEAVRKGADSMSTELGDVGDTTGNSTKPQYDPGFDFLQSVIDCSGAEDPCRQYEVIKVWFGMPPTNVPSRVLALNIPTAGTNGDAAQLQNLSCLMGFYTFDPSLLHNGDSLTHPNFGMTNQEAAAAICECKSHPWNSSGNTNTTTQTIPDTLQSEMSDACEVGCENHRQAFAQAIDNWVVEYNRARGVLSMTDVLWRPIDSINGLDRACTIQAMIDQCKRQCQMEKTNSINADSLTNGRPAYRDSILSPAFQAAIAQEQLEFQQAMTWDAEFAPIKHPTGNGGGYSDFGSMEVMQQDLLAFIKGSMDEMLQHPTNDAAVSAHGSMYFRGSPTAHVEMAHRRKDFAVKVNGWSGAQNRLVTATVNLFHDTLNDRLTEVNVILYCDFHVDTTGPQPVYSGTRIAHWSYQPACGSCNAGPGTTTADVFLQQHPDRIGYCKRLDPLSRAVGITSAEIASFYFDAQGILHAVAPQTGCPAVVVAAGICPQASSGTFSFTVGNGGQIGQTLRLEIASRLDYFDLYSPAVEWRGTPIATASAIVSAINGNPTPQPFVASNLDGNGAASATVRIEVQPDFEGTIADLQLDTIGRIPVAFHPWPDACGKALDSILVNSGCSQPVDSSRRECPYGFFKAVEMVQEYPATDPGIDHAIADMIEFVYESSTTILRTRKSERLFRFTYLPFDIASDFDTLDFKIGDAEFRCSVGFWYRPVDTTTGIPRCPPAPDRERLLKFDIKITQCPRGNNTVVAWLQLSNTTEPPGMWPDYQHPRQLAPDFTSFEDLFGLFIEHDGSGRLKFMSQNDNANAFALEGMSGDPQRMGLWVANGGKFRENIYNIAHSINPCGPPPVQCEVCMRWSKSEMPPSLTGSAAMAAEPYTCAQALDEYIDNTVELALDSCLAARLEQMKTSYQNACLNRITDKCNISLGASYHHYTLYYYDRANHLIATVPPEGVAFLDTLQQKQVARHRKDRLQPPLYPEHFLQTTYEYNSIQQVMAQHSPDGGTSRFWYNAAGQLVLSQDAQQAVEGKYSYSRYDNLGRIVESGVLLNFVPTFASGNPTIITELWDQASFPLNLAGLQRREVVHTVYTEADTTISYLGRPQTHLRNRISHVWKDEENNGNVHNSTWYSYDEHGSVEWVKQELPALGQKSMRYEYHLVSGSVNKVYYQEGTEEQFIHRYEYDADNRIVAVYTSKDDKIWERDAHYEYYLHGPLARKELGEDKIQGMDYVYTIEGYLKSINQVELDSVKDPGRDGIDTVGYLKDEFAMELGYYEGDYNRTNVAIGQGNAGVYPYGGSGGMTKPVNDLYNGNISYWMSNIRAGQASGSGINPVGMQMREFRYDALNRIKNANWRKYENGNWLVSDGTYNEAFTYDANGNIKTLMRNGFVGNGSTTVAMDQLTYRYNNSGGRLLDNRLYHLNDGVSGSPYTDDLEDQGPANTSNFTTANNYRYDAEGNLTADLSEGIQEITWNAANKVKEVLKTNGDRIGFVYDALGNRIIKTHLHAPMVGQQQSMDGTYYVRDASGNPMGIYSMTYRAADDSTIWKLDEQPIYGAERLGEYRPELILARGSGILRHPVTAADNDPGLLGTWLLPGNANVTEVDFSTSGAAIFSDLGNQQSALPKAHTAVHTDRKGQYLFGAFVTDESVPQIVLMGKDKTPMPPSVSGPIRCGSGLNMEPVIIPKPGITHHYYLVFHLGQGFSRIQAVEVDMDARGGNGDIVGDTISIALGSLFGHKILALTYADGNSRLLLNGKSADGKSLTLHRIDVNGNGFSAPTLIGIAPMPSDKVVRPENDMALSADGKRLAIGLQIDNVPNGYTGADFYDVMTWELDASTLSLRRPQNFSLHSGKVRRVEFSASADYVFTVRQVNSGYKLERLKLLNNTAQLAVNSAVDLNVQRIAGGALLFHAAGNSLQKLEDPETAATTFTTSVVNQALNIKAGEFPQATFPVNGAMQALVERVKTEDRNWIASTSGSAGASGMNTLYFPPTGNPVVGNPVAGNYGASRCISIGENLHDSLDFRHVGRVGWTNANFVYRPDNSLMTNSLDVKGVADLPSITVELPGGERGYYLITCADGKVLWHQVALTGGELGVVRKNQSLKLETGGYLEYDPLYPQVAMAAYNDQTLAGGTILFVATKRYGAVSLYSFRLYPDRIAAGKLAQQFGTLILLNGPIPTSPGSNLRQARPEQLNPGLRLSEMQISPNGQELSISMTETETAGLPVRHRFERFQLDPVSVTGLNYLGYKEVQGEAALAVLGDPVSQILSHDYSPDGKYIYFLQKGRLPFTMRPSNPRRWTDAFVPTNGTGGQTVFTGNNAMLTPNSNATHSGGNVATQSNGNHAATSNMRGAPAGRNAAALRAAPQAAPSSNLRVAPGGGSAQIFASPGLLLRRLNLQTSLLETIETYPCVEQNGVVRRGADDRLYLNYQPNGPGNNYVPTLLGYGSLDNDTAATVRKSRTSLNLKGGLNRSGLPLQAWRRYGEVAPAAAYAAREVGARVYELNDHLGNVRVTVGDVRGHLDLGNGGIGFGEVGVLSFGDYYAFGSLKVGRGFSETRYKYGFNGKENDQETGMQDYGMRIYSPRLARFLSVDPLSTKYPHYSPFHFAGNTPIVAIDLDGTEDIWKVMVEYEIGKYYENTNKTAYDVDSEARKSLSESMGGAKIPNSGVVYCFEHLNGTREIRKMQETADIVDYKHIAPIRWLLSFDNWLRGTGSTQARDDNDSYTGKEGMEKGANVVDIAGDVLNATVVLAPLGRGLKFEAFALRTISDFNNKPMSKALLNAGVRIGTMRIGDKLDKVIDGIPGNSQLESESKKLIGGKIIDGCESVITDDPDGGDGKPRSP